MSAPYRRIACCVEQDEMAADVIAEGLRLTGGTGTGLVLVHVVAPPAALAMSPFAYVAPVAESRPGAESWLAGLAEALPGARTQVLEGFPATAVTEWAGRAGADLIIAAARRGIVERTLLGGFAAHLAYHAPCPLLLVPRTVHEEAADDPVSAAAAAGEAESPSF